MYIRVTQRQFRGGNKTMNLSPEERIKIIFKLQGKHQLVDEEFLPPYSHGIITIISFT